LTVPARPTTVRAVTSITWEYRAPTACTDAGGRPMHCPSCNARNEPNAENCFTCGRTFGPSKGSVIGQRYEILELLGRGGMGTIYKARDRVLDETVALKTMRWQLAGDAAMVRRFRAEIKVARRVRHRNICAIHDYGEEGSLLYISMEFIDGVDLRQILREEGGLPADKGFDVAVQVAKGLEAIHEAGVVHRDLKGHNIMRDARGVIKLLDFGLAKQEDADGGMTATGQIVGTPEYMSPEQVRGDKVDYRSDLYALGIVIFEIFTGRVPFRGDTPVLTIFKHLQEEPPLSGPDAEGIPATVIPVLKRLLAKSPSDRFGSAGEVIDALREARRTTLASSLTPPQRETAPVIAPRPRPIGTEPRPAPAPTVVADPPRRVRDRSRRAPLDSRAARIAAAVLVFLPLRSSVQAKPMPAVTVPAPPKPAGPPAPVRPTAPGKRDAEPNPKLVHTETVSVKAAPPTNSSRPGSSAPNPPVSPTLPNPASGTASASRQAPTLPSPAQLRAEQVAGLLGRAEAAMSEDRHEAAVHHFEEVLVLEPQNSSATAGLEKARRLATIARKSLLPGESTSCEPGNPGKTRADFINMSAPEFNAKIEFEPSVTKPRPGQPYAIKINVRNDGLKPARIQGVSIVNRVNDVAESTAGSARLKELEPGQKALLDEITGVWKEGTTTWALDVAVTAKNKDTCRNTLSWK
jgi:serine/threonine-protein kinase